MLCNHTNTLKKRLVVENTCASAAFVPRTPVLLASRAYVPTRSRVAMLPPRVSSDPGAEPTGSRLAAKPDLEGGSGGTGSGRGGSSSGGGGSGGSNGGAGQALLAP